MPKVSKATAATVEDIGIGTVHEGTTDGYEFTFLDLRERGDLAPLLKGLPHDMCSCPHWGYVVSGTVTFTFPDHEETFRAGDAFHVAPPHSPVIEAGTEVLLISPEQESAVVNEVIRRNMAAMQQA
jgi:mannose-6-phosphate isomerase-like protein (cupin superfamily)